MGAISGLRASPNGFGYNYKWERLEWKLPPCSQDHWWFRGSLGKSTSPCTAFVGISSVQSAVSSVLFLGGQLHKRVLRNLSLCRSNAFYSRTISLSLPSPIPFPASFPPASFPPPSLALTLFEIQDFTGTRCINGVDRGSTKWLTLAFMLTWIFKFPSRVASVHSYQLGMMFS